jgi:hypothetical protein
MPVASDVQPVTTGEECHEVIQPSFDRRKLVLSHSLKTGD